MSNKPEVERAAEFRRIIRTHALPAHADIDWAIDRAHTALSAAGLLRTDADRLYAELAEAMVAYCNKFPRLEGHVVLDEHCDEQARVWAAMRAILDARKPKQSPLDEVLSLWRECKCKVPGPLSDALDRLERERAK